MNDISSVFDIVCLMGPTAVGKTDFAISLAKRYPFEIISVDSAMVYRGMDIGTAKPSLAIREKIPHHLIDICNPNEIYSAGKFCQDVLQLIKLILNKERIPLLVGGTMLYFRSLQHGLSELPTANQRIRQQINEEAKQFGWSALHQRLTIIDPIAAKRIHPHDTQRIQRALEIYQLTGKSLTTLQTEKTGILDNYRVLNIGLMPENREVLRKKIAIRFHQMLAEGLIEEVEKLYHQVDLHADLPAIRAVNYRQVWQYLSGHLLYDEMINQAIIACQQLAKRQLTWLRSWPELQIFPASNDKLLDLFNECLYLQHT